VRFLRLVRYRRYLLFSIVYGACVKVEELLNLIACPKCHAKLRAVDAPDQTSGLLCESCKLLFAYDDGLPNMLISEARSWPLAAAPRST
jgi:uncharacterized protein YbaR (Trm112 family)